MANTNHNNPPPPQAPPAVLQPIRSFRDLAQQHLEPDRNDCTEQLVALAARKREDEAAAMQDDLINRAEAFLANRNMSSLQAAQVIVQSITDPELRSRLQSELEKKKADAEAESNGRAAIGVVALLGEPCMNTIYDKPCTRRADPKLGNHLCRSCHKNLTRMSKDLPAEQRMIEKESRKRQRKEDKEIRRQQLLDAINEKRARRPRVPVVAVPQRSVQNGGQSNVPPVPAIASRVELPPQPSQQQLTATAPSFSLVPYAEPAPLPENRAHLQLTSLLQDSGSSNNHNEEVDLDTDYNDADAHEDALELAQANENDANDSDYNKGDELDHILNDLDIDKEDEGIVVDGDPMDFD